MIELGHSRMVQVTFLHAHLMVASVRANRTLSDALVADARRERMASAQRDAKVSCDLFIYICQCMCSLLLPVGVRKTDEGRNHLHRATNDQSLHRCLCPSTNNPSKIADGPILRWHLELGSSGFYNIAGYECKTHGRRGRE